MIDQKLHSRVLYFNIYKNYAMNNFLKDATSAYYVLIQGNIYETGCSNAIYESLQRFF